MHDFYLYEIKDFVSSLYSIYDILGSNIYLNRKISKNIYILNKILIINSRFFTRVIIL